MSKNNTRHNLTIMLIAKMSHANTNIDIFIAKCQLGGLTTELLEHIAIFILNGKLPTSPLNQRCRIAKSTPTICYGTANTGYMNP
ncbi:MAG TPA: hypothetical protein DEO38_01445 [Bacteroidales bacterium]|nr:hypothetical protein [Bacteroidales bacterium]